MTYEFNILYYINIYKKVWRKIVITGMFAMFVTFVLSSFAPVNYVSKITFLTAKEESPAGYLGKVFGVSGSSSNDVILAILQSKRMAKDISEAFELDKKKKFNYNMEIHNIKGGLEVGIIGTDSVLTEKIANFTVANLDKINTELNITTAKPMVKVLDPAVRGVSQSRRILRKMLIAGVLAFLIISIHAFFSDYIKKLKSSQAL
jgi:uncharacterized protein involved in exopolysaccharide biosynthesis